MRKKDLLKLVRAYDEKQVSGKKKIGNKIIKKAFFTIMRILLPYMIPLFILALILFFVNKWKNDIINFIYFGGRSVEVSYNNTEDWAKYFPSDHNLLPLGIPVERGVLTAGYDVQSFINFLNLDFLKYSRTYLEHSGVDFARQISDRSNDYFPSILATHNGVVKRYDIRSENEKTYSYRRVILKNGSYVQLGDIEVNKRDKNTRPYGNSVVLSTDDGRYYTIYAHLNDINTGILQNGYLYRGEFLGTMGNSGNTRGSDNGTHLHYEIRYCGDDNSNMRKGFTECEHINPMSIIPGSDMSFIGMKSIKSLEVKAGTEDTRENVFETSEVALGNEFQNFCDNIENILSEGLDCKWLFVIYKQNENKGNLPGEEDVYDIGEKYISYNYPGFQGTESNVTDIIIEEGISRDIKTKEELYKGIGQYLSYGKFQNRFVIYDKRDGDVDEETLFNDTIDTINDILQETEDPELFFSTYYYRSQYGVRENPYVYNMSSKNTIFLPILNSKREKIKTYLDNGAITLYNLIQ